MLRENGGGGDAAGIRIEGTLQFRLEACQKNPDFKG
jgi:hypothetical protein